MRKIDYQERIAECAKRAETAPNEDARRIWKRMEDFWRAKASETPQPLRTFRDLRTIGSPPTALR